MKKLFSLLFFITIAFNTVHAQSATSSYIRDYKILANTYSAQYGIPASVIMGVAIVESSSGKGRIVTLLNNHFGIVGKNNLMQTKGIKTRYKQYADASASYKAFCIHLASKKLYARLKGTKNNTDWLKAIAATGYSSQPVEWARRIDGVIKSYKL